jgi:lipopolysaccharide/colanic/teichoic acid biosynthesis glycosyltransferase
MMPEQLEMYGDPRAYFALRPGITGLWQVSARNSSRFTYRNEVDDAYERSLTLKMDFTILFKTIGVVLRPTGH